MLDNETAIRLPDDPKDTAYEDLVAACLLAHGYFVESQLTLRHENTGTEVLEFDAIATPSADAATEAILVEAKSGKSVPFETVFKLYGQRSYMNLHRAWLLHRVDIPEDRRPVFEELSDGTGVTLHRVGRDALSQAKEAVPCAFDADPALRATLARAAWWGRYADRLVQARFTNWYKSHSEPLPDAVLMARTYARSVMTAFFKPTPVERALALYDAYKAAPKLTNVLVEHAAASGSHTAEAVRKRTWNTAELPWLQHIMMLEWRARLRLVKNAFEYKFRTPPAPQAGGFEWVSILSNLLPASFHEGMDKLEAHPHALRVPYLLQIFVEAFGGFYTSARHGDLDLLAALTGIPADEVEPALNLIDAFFEIDSGWFLEGDGGFRMLKGLPAYARGTGCFLRRAHGRFEDYAAYCAPKAWHLGQWHNALYGILAPDLTVTVPSVSSLGSTP